MANICIITSGLIITLMVGQNSATKLLLFVDYDDMNYTDAKEACESFRGRLADPSSFTTDEKLDIMQCIPPDVVFWTNQKGSKDACLITFHLDIKCFYERRYYQHDFLCEAEKDTIRYSRHLRMGHVCNHDKVHSTPSPIINTTPPPTRPSPGTMSMRTSKPIMTLQTIGTRPPRGGNTTTPTPLTTTQPSVNGTNGDYRNERKETGGVSSIGTAAAVIVFVVILVFSIFGIFYIYVKRKKPELLRRASFWKNQEQVQNEYDTVHPRQGQEHSYGCMQAQESLGDYLQPNPSAIRSRNIDNIDYLVEADDNIISGVDNASVSGQAAQENDYDYIHIDDADCRKPPSAPYDLAQAIPNNDYEKFSQSNLKVSTISSQHDYYNTPNSRTASPNVSKKPKLASDSDKSCT